MKYFLTLLGVAFLVALVFVFRGAKNTVNDMMDKVEVLESSFTSKKKKGNGDVVEEIRELRDFHAIYASNAIDVMLKQGDEEKVVVKVDSNLQENVKAKVEDGTLKLYVENARLFTEIKVFVTFKDLNSVTLLGATELESQGGIKAKDFVFSVSGASEVNLEDFLAENVKVTASGAAELHLRGKCKKLDINASGASEVDLSKFEAEDVIAVASGASDVDVNVLKSLDANASGASDIDYTGNPTIIDTEESASGDIAKH